MNPTRSVAISYSFLMHNNWARKKDRNGQLGDYGCWQHASTASQLLVACPKVDESKFQTVFGPSSSLRDKIENGQRCGLFISANSTHTDALVKAEIFGRAAVLGLNPTVLVYRSEINRRG